MAQARPSDKPSRSVDPARHAYRRVSPPWQHQRTFAGQSLNHPGDDWKSGHTTPAGRLRRFGVHPVFRQTSINDCYRARDAMTAVGRFPPIRRRPQSAENDPLLTFGEAGSRRRDSWKLTLRSKKHRANVSARN